jgi:molybdate transport system ATP-binding protein
MLVADLETGAGTFRLRAALRVDSGRTLVLFGASGSGKTLLLRSLAGIHGPVQGRVELDGVTLLDSARGVEVPPQARRLGYVPQSYALFPHLTVSENVAFGLRHLRPADRRRRVDALLESLQLGGLAGRRPAQLSGGQQQRVALARALAPEPRLLLLDEPFAALDAPLRRLLRRELQTLHHRFGFALLFVTHDLGDACALGDRIAVVDAGRIVQVGTPEEILYRPAGPVVARLTGMRNVFPARVTGAAGDGLEVATDRFTVRTPPYPFQIGARVDLYVRPELVQLVRPAYAPDAGTEAGLTRPGRNRFAGHIVEELRLGPVHTLYFRLAAPGGGTLPVLGDDGGAPVDLEVDIAAHPYQALRVAERRDWTLALPPEALHVTPPGEAP